MQQGFRRGRAALRAPFRLAALAAAVAACGAPAPAPPPNLLLLVVDTLRRDHLGAYGYARDTSPFIDVFAAEGIRFDRAYAAAPWTQASVGSLLTGLHPGGHGVEKLFQKLPESVPTLAEILRDAGYATAGVVSHFLLSPRFQFDQGFDSYQVTEPQGVRVVSTPEVVRVAKEQLAELAESGRPFFLMVHFFDPHHEYRSHRRNGFAARSAGRIRGDEDVKTLRRLDPPPTPEEVQFLEDLYDEEIRFTDAGVGSVLLALERLGVGDRTVVVLTADHGEEFFERGWLGHTRTLYDELIRVPLVIRLPGSEGAGRVVDELVSMVSLTPTLLELLGVAAPPDAFQAPSFAPLLRGGGGYEPGPVLSEVDVATHVPPPGIISVMASRRALVEGRYKLIEDRFTNELTLYDLVADPEEREDLSSRPSERERVRAMHERLEHAAARVRARRLSDATAPLDEEDRRMLRELGYLE